MIKLSKQRERKAAFCEYFSILTLLLGAAFQTSFNPLTPTVAIWVSYLKHPVPDRVKKSFVILTSWHSGAQG